MAVARWGSAPAVTNCNTSDQVRQTPRADTVKADEAHVLTHPNREIELQPLRNRTSPKYITYIEPF